jgi:tetratricopeptide (TPR) repeat protein
MAVRREQVVKTAEKLVARGKIEAAIKEYRKVLGDQPNDTNTLNRMGDLYLRDGRPDEAIKLFNQTADAYTEDGFFVKAIAIYKKIQKLDPNRLEVYEKLADLYHRQGLINEARSQYQVVAEWYLKHGKSASALSIVERMVDLEPGDPSHRAKLAELYQEQRLTDKAMAQYKSIAELMLDHGRPGEAAKVYERALDLDAGDLGFITDAVLRLREAGSTAAAAHLLAVAVEKNPEAASVARLARLERGGTGVRAAAAPVAAGPAHGAEASAAAEVAEPEPAAEAEQAPEAGPEPAAAGVAAVESAAAGEAAPAGDADLVLDLDLDELEELPFGVEPPAPPVAAEAPPAPPLAPPHAATARVAPADGETGEFELDLDDSFVLDLEDDEPPASLVQPPPDLAEEPPLAFRERARVAEQAAEVATGASAGGIEEPPAEPSAPPPPEAELPDLEEGVFVLDEGVTAAEEAVEEPAAPPPAAVEQGAAAIDTDFLERTAAELLPPERQAEDLLTEAEVLAKYGLEEKASERLQEVLRLAPGHPEAMALLVRLDLDRGYHPRVVSIANQLARRAAESGDDRAWRKVRRRLVEAGYKLDGDRVTAAPPQGADTERAVGRMIEGLLDEQPATAGRRERAGGEERVEAALAEIEAGLRAPRPAAGEAAEAIEAAEAGEEFEEAAAYEEFEEAPPLEEFEEAWAWGPAATEPTEPLAAAPGEPAPPAVEEPEAVGAEALQPPAAELEDSGTRWLADVEAAAATLGASAADPALAEEEGFFDLAAEIEQELDAEEEAREELLTTPREQTLEEIVEGFKQGVSESLSAEDYDTHFNLGIAYREMGLLDEAIGEFQLAAKDPSRLVECCSMLGLCFLEKGLPELAVKWYQRGLASPGLTEDDQLGLLYDLGNVHLATGDVDQARSVYVEIYGTNSNYRDVVAKLEEISAHYDR